MAGGVTASRMVKRHSEAETRPFLTVIDPVETVNASHDRVEQICRSSIDHDAVARAYFGVSGPDDRERKDAVSVG